jgi:hypothetical protein
MSERNIYRRSSLEFAHFVLIHLQTWLPQAIPVLDWSISKNLDLHRGILASFGSFSHAVSEKILRK